MPRYHETGYKKNISKFELSLLLKAIPEPNFRLIFLIMACMGLRVGEVCRIKINDILDDCSRLRLILEKSNKVHERVIPDKIRPILLAYITRFRPKAYLFTPAKLSHSKNTFIQPSTVRWRLIRLRRELGLDDIYYTCKDGKELQRISCHTMRHFFITEFYEQSGHDIALTRKVIGHSKIETTLLYINPKTREKEITNMITF